MERLSTFQARAERAEAHRLIRVPGVNGRESEDFISPDEQMGDWAHLAGNELVAFNPDLQESGGWQDCPGTRASDAHGSGSVTSRTAARPATTVTGTTTRLGFQYNMARPACGLLAFGAVGY